MLSKGRCKTTSGFFIIPLLSQLWEEKTYCETRNELSSWRPVALPNGHKHLCLFKVGYDVHVLLSSVMYILSGKKITAVYPMSRRCARDNLRGQKSLGPLKMSLEMAHKVILPPKKIISRSFLNSGTLIVIETGANRESRIAFERVSFPHWTSQSGTRDCFPAPASQSGPTGRNIFFNYLLSPKGGPTDFNFYDSSTK
jgi:hypothetical protein